MEEEAKPGDVYECNKKKESHVVICFTHSLSRAVVATRSRITSGGTLRLEVV